MIIIIYVIVAILAAALVGGLLYLYSLPADYTVSRSREMDVAGEKIFNSVLDFKSWPKWGPWLPHAPNTKLEYSSNLTQEGGHYTWQSKVIGAGKLTHVKIEKPHYIEQKIEFIKPIRGVCKVEWEFAPIKGGKTKVTWTMHGRVPFFFRFMTKNLDRMIGLDYEMGLIMLNRLLDAKADLLRLEYTEIVSRPGCRGVYEACSSSLKELATVMPKAYDRVSANMDKRKIKAIGPAFTAYRKVDMRKLHAQYDCVVPVADSVQDTTYAQTYAGGKYMKVRMYGSYAYMEHAWHSAMNHMRMKKYKMDKKRPSLEVYEVDMLKAKSPNEYVTDLYVPIK